MSYEVTGENGKHGVSITGEGAYLHFMGSLLPPKTFGLALGFQPHPEELLRKLGDALRR
jgi:hypothetical protein